MKSNLHTHTTRCGHAVGADRDYVEAAIRGGFSVLGFSDHVPWPYASDYRHPNVRMDVDQLPEYVGTIRALAKQYEGKLRILTGFECEYFPAYIPWLKEMAEAWSLDYLILGNHYDTSDEVGPYFGGIQSAALLSRYVTMTLKGLETGLFTYLAHPDLFLNRWGKPFDEDCRRAARDLCQACHALGIPMEYNTHMRYEHPNGRMPGYPNRDFFEIAQAEGVRVSIGIDAHQPQELSDPHQWDQSLGELEALGITPLDLPALRSFSKARG